MSKRPILDVLLSAHGSDDTRTERLRKAIPASGSASDENLTAAAGLEWGRVRRPELGLLRNGVKPRGADYTLAEVIGALEDANLDPTVVGLNLTREQFDAVLRIAVLLLLELEDCTHD